MKQITFFCLLLSSSLSFSAEKVTSSPTQIELGKVLFLENCMACHGEKGDGKGIAAAAIPVPKPRDFTTGNFRHGMEHKDIFRTISEGSEGTAMPPWKDMLTEDEITSLVHYVKSLKISKAK